MSASFLRRFGPCGLSESSFCAAYGLAEYTLAVSNRGTTIRSFDAKGISENQVRVTERDGSNTNGFLVSVSDDLLIIEKRIIGGSVTIEMSRASIETVEPI